MTTTTSHDLVRSALVRLSEQKVPGTCITKFHSVSDIAREAGVSQGTARRHCEMLCKYRGYEKFKEHGGKAKYRFILTTR